MRAHTTPMVVTGMGEDGERASALERLPLDQKARKELLNEHWLQMLIQRHPTLLPVDQIEPALTPLVPVCVELPLPSGSADNLMITPDGGIVLVEAKLWSNGEARREVIGQVLDYAKDLSRLSYEAFEAAIGVACRDRTLNLFAKVCGDDATHEDETRFIDAVSRNLRLGRFLLIIAGDGIQESAEQLADFLQRHIGLHFTLAMVEISLWRLPETGQVFVQPKILTRTVQIERAVVRLEEGVALAPSRIVAAPTTAKPTTISAETFYEGLKVIDATLPDRLKAFLAELEPLGVYPDIKRTLTLKWRSPDGREFRLGSIDQTGRFASDIAHGDAQAIGRLDLSHAYQAYLAASVSGLSVRQTANPVGWRLVLDGQNPPASILLGHKAAWLNAITDYLEALRHVLEPKLV